MTSNNPQLAGIAQLFDAVAASLCIVACAGHPLLVDALIAATMAFAALGIWNLLTFR
jgi:hypothetical protein